MVNILPIVSPSKGQLHGHPWLLIKIASVTVLLYILSREYNRSLPLKNLSLNLAMLFSLTRAGRILALTKLDLRPRRFLPEGVKLMLSAPRKRGSTT